MITLILLDYSKASSTALRVKVQSLLNDSCYSAPQPCKPSGILPFFHLCTHCSFLVTWLTPACPSKFSLEVTSFKNPSLTPIVQFSQTGLNAPILMLIYCHCLLTSFLSIILKGKDCLKYSSLRL